MIHRLIIACVLLIAPACAPISVTVDLGPRDTQLEATPVLDRDASRTHQVALIDLRGLIADRRPRTLLGPGANPVDAFLARLHEAEQDSSVVGVIVRINSPGGTVTASDILYRELRRFRETSGKPLIASLGEVAASGGYYAALACDEIFCEPTTITGSIGVLIPTINISEGLSMIGVRARAITSGANKDLANPLTPERQSHVEILQGLVDEMYARFVRLVEQRRPGFRSETHTDAVDGRVMTGARAVAIGLADRVGGVREAKARIEEITGVEHTRLIKYHAKGTVVRTPYALVEPMPTQQPPNPPLLDLGAITPGGLQAGTAYYLWLP